MGKYGFPNFLAIFFVTCHTYLRLIVVDYGWELEGLFDMELTGVPALLGCNLVCLISWTHLQVRAARCKNTLSLMALRKQKKVLFLCVPARFSVKAHARVTSHPFRLLTSCSSVCPVSVKASRPRELVLAIDDNALLPRLTCVLQKLW
jgi:hypothetical protein